MKFLFKEDFINKQGNKVLFYLAPVLSLLPGALAFAAIPLSAPIHLEVFELFGKAWGPYTFNFQTFYLNVGVVFVLGASSLAAYPLLLAGWGSGNKYSLMGALRASAQTVSYELALGLCVLAMVILYSSFDFAKIIEAQNQALSFTLFSRDFHFGFLPNWGIFYQPLGAILLFTALFAESNRLPFDLPEAEAELVAGYHTEYGGVKMIMFYMGEYGHMLVASALMVVLYFGGYTFYPFLTPETVMELLKEFSPNKAAIFKSLILHLCFFIKIFLFLWFFIWVRWTLPRFRYDQLMSFGWVVLLPWSLFNVILTAFFALRAWEFF